MKKFLAVLLPIILIGSLMSAFAVSAQPGCVAPGPPGTVQEHVNPRQVFSDGHADDFVINAGFVGGAVNLRATSGGGAPIVAGGPVPHGTTVTTTGVYHPAWVTWGWNPATQAMGWVTHPQNNAWWVQIQVPGLGGIIRTGFVLNCFLTGWTLP